jgi:hypothetical protein
MREAWKRKRQDRMLREEVSPELQRTQKQAAVAAGINPATPLNEGGRSTEVEGQKKRTRSGQ